MNDINLRFDPRQLNGTLDRSKEQIIPGHDSDYWLEFHLMFYRHAVPYCKGNVLDIGCGYGYGSNLLAETADSVLGIDYHQPAIDYARSHYVRDNLRYEQHDANTPLPCEDGSIDLVVSSEVLEHIKNQEELLKEIRRIGRPGGFAIIKTPQSPDGKEDDNPHHHHTFTQDEFAEVFRSIFPKAEILLWNQSSKISQKMVKLDRNNQDLKFGDPYPSESAVLIYSQTTAAKTPPDPNNKFGDLLAICPF